MSSTHRFNPRPDLLVVGAGPVGSVVAERAASELGWSVTILDRRDHVAGNCHDALHESGVLIHRYGPHYFRTDSERVIAYLSRFTNWIPASYTARSSVGGRLFPFPVNLTTLETFFGRSFAGESDARRFLESRRVPLDGPPRNAEEQVTSQVGREIYEAFYRGYTEKQWGRPPAALDPSITARIPIRFDRDERYVRGRFQQMPEDGYTALFDRVLDHPRIEKVLGVEFADVRKVIHPARATLYTGPLDEYFDRRWGTLPWRSFRMELVAMEKELHQPVVQIMYPGDEPYTRSVEIKHVTRQVIPRTVVSYEFPQASGEPFYPVLSPESRGLLELYQEAARRETAERAVHFAGRLATFRYINTDEAVEMALDTFERIRNPDRGPALQGRGGPP